MSVARGSAEQALPAELMAVAESAGARLRAETDDDSDAARSGAESLLNAATSAMNAGYSLKEIAEAEAYGKHHLRETLRGDVLKRVERSGRVAREAQTEHHAAIARAMRLGLSTREIAAAAGVTHGTIRAISNRVAAISEAPAVDTDDPQPTEDAPETIGTEPEPYVPEQRW